MEICEIPEKLLSYSPADGLEDKVNQLYPESSTFRTRKGEWVVKKRHNHSISVLGEKKHLPDSFVSLYYSFKEGKLQTLFRGNLDAWTEPILESTCTTLSKTVLEQSRYFSFPPRGLRMAGSSNLEGNPMNFFTAFGTYAAAACMTGLVLSDITALYATFTGQFEHASMTVLFADYLKTMNNANMPGALAGVMVLVASPIVAGALVDIYFGNRIRQAADSYRVRDIPQAALGFSYGSLAESLVLEENRQVEDLLNKKKAQHETGLAIFKFSSRLKEMGYVLDTASATSLYNALRDSECQGFLEGLKDFAKAVPNVPVGKAVLAYDSIRFAADS